MKQLNCYLSFRLQGSTASSSDIQYCWSGEEGDNINWKNLSCATNELSLPDIVASKSLPLVSNVTGESNAAGLSGRKYYCMVFKYNVTKVNDTTGDITNQVKADYTCDAENWCEGRQMLEGYQVLDIFFEFPKCIDFIGLIIQFYRLIYTF